MNYVYKLDVVTYFTWVFILFKVIKSLQVLQRTETQWNILVDEIFDLEDTLKNMNTNDKQFKSTFQKSKNNVIRFFYNSKIGT